MEPTTIDRPEIPEDMQNKWQRIVDLMAEIIDVPSGLIMRVTPPEIEVYKTSRSQNNPFEEGAVFPLDGVYCEWVTQNCEQLLVPNALNDAKWDHNPDLEFDMVSYLGFPLLWPDGQPFGTICVSDTRENAYNDVYASLIREFKEVIENDFKLMLAAMDISRKKEMLEEANKELRKFNEAMIDREMKIIAMKKEVNRLCAELGKDSVYPPIWDE